MGEERQERAGAHDTEHVAEARAGRHLEVLNDVADHALAMSTALLTEMR
jgi:hypothetical protein